MRFVAFITGNFLKFSPIFGEFYPLKKWKKINPLFTNFCLLTLISFTCQDVILVLFIITNSQWLPEQLISMRILIKLSSVVSRHFLRTECRLVSCLPKPAFPWNVMLIMQDRKFSKASDCTKEFGILPFAVRQV